MTQNVFTADIGTAGTFQDSRTPAQHTANLVREQEDKRQAKITLEDKLASNQANAKLFEGLATLGIRVGENMAAAKLWGEATNEAEAIALIESQGANLGETIDNFTELAQARNAGTISYEKAQIEMQRLMRRAKHDNPLFAYSIDKAASKFLTGLPGSGATSGGGTLTSLSAAEQEVQKYKAEVAGLMSRTGWSQDYAVNHLQKVAIGAEKVKLAEQKKAMALANEVSSGVASEQIAEQVYVAKSRITDDLYQAISMALQANPNGLSTEQRTELKAQIGNAYSQLNAALAKSIETTTANNDTFTMDNEVMDNIERTLDADRSALLAFVDEENLETNMSAIRNATEAGLDMYMMENHPEFTFLRDQVFKGDMATMLAYKKNGGLNALYKSDPTFKRLLDDYNLTTTEGMQAMRLSALDNAFNTNDVDRLRTDIEAATLDQQGNSELQEAVAAAAGDAETGAELVRNLAGAAADDPDVPYAYYNMPSYVTRALEDPQYAKTVLLPITDAGVDGVVSAILTDNNGINPNLTITTAGRTVDDNVDAYTSRLNLPEKYARHRAQTAATNDPIRFEIEGISKNQQRQLNEMLHGLMKVPTVLGLSPTSTDKERADAAIEYITNKMQRVIEVVPEEVDMDLSGAEATLPTAIEQISATDQAYVDSLRGVLSDEDFMSILNSRGWEVIDGSVVRRL